MLELKSIAENARSDYLFGRISREEAKDLIQPYLDYINEKSRELAKKYNQKHKEITFMYYIR